MNIILLPLPQGILEVLINKAGFRILKEGKQLQRNNASVPNWPAGQWDNLISQTHDCFLQFQLTFVKSKEDSCPIEFSVVSSASITKSHN